MTFAIKQSYFFFPLCLCIFFPIEYVSVNSNRVIETFRFVTSSELSACKYIYISKCVLVKTTNVLCKKLEEKNKNCSEVSDPRSCGFPVRKPTASYGHQ